MSLKERKEEGRKRLYFTFGVIFILISILLFVCCIVDNKRIEKIEGEVSFFLDNEGQRNPIVDYTSGAYEYKSVLRNVSDKEWQIGDKIEFYIDRNYPKRIVAKYVNLDPIAIILLVAGCALCMAYRAGTKNYYRKFFKRYRFTYIFVILTIIANLGFWVYVRYLDGDSILEEFSYKKMVFASCLLMGSLLVDVIMSMYVQNRYEKAHLESDED